MAHMILRTMDGHELGRRPMDPHERFAVYRTYSAGELFTWAHGYYRVHTVAWRVPEEELIVSVTFDSWAPVESSVDD